MARSGWCISCVAITTLLRTKMELEQPKAQESFNEALIDQTVGRKKMIGQLRAHH